MSSQDWDDWAKEIDEDLERTYQYLLKSMEDQWKNLIKI